MNVALCTPHRPNQKGTVENAVRTIKNHLKELVKPIKSINQLHQIVRLWNRELNEQQHHEKNDTIIQLHQYEKIHFHPIPKKTFVYYHSKLCKVTKNGIIRFQTNSYSVPEAYSRKMVEVYYCDHTITIKNLDCQILAEYARDTRKFQKHNRIWHMLHKIKTKAPGFINSHEYKLMPKYLKILHDKLCEKHTHFFVQLLEHLQFQPQKALKEFIFTLHQENITYEQLKDILKFE